MADLESVLADVSYLMAMERSKAPNAKTVKRFSLPDPRWDCQSLMLGEGSNPIVVVCGVNMVMGRGGSFF